VVLAAHPIGDLDTLAVDDQHAVEARVRHHHERFGLGESALVVGLLQQQERRLAAGVAQVPMQ